MRAVTSAAPVSAPVDDACTDTVGCSHVTDFDTPGCRKSSRSYSQQYEPVTLRGESGSMARRAGASFVLSESVRRSVHTSADIERQILREGLVRRGTPATDATPDYGCRVVTTDPISRPGSVDGWHCPLFSPCIPREPARRRTGFSIRDSKGQRLENPAPHTVGTDLPARTIVGLDCWGSGETSHGGGRTGRAPDAGSAVPNEFI